MGLEIQQCFENLSFIFPLLDAVNGRNIWWEAFSKQKASRKIDSYRQKQPNKYISCELFSDTKNLLQFDEWL